MQFLSLFLLVGSLLSTAKARLAHNDGDELPAPSIARVLGVGLKPTLPPYEPPGFKPTTTPTSRTKKPTTPPTRSPTRPVPPTPTRRPTAPYPCSLCRPNERPFDPNATIPFRGQTRTCKYVHNLGILTSKINPSNCDFYRNLGQIVCECSAGTIPPVANKCRLCENGSALPFPFRKVLGGVTCRSIQDGARRDKASNCYKYQGAIGPACGCYNPKAVTRVCHLCDNKKQLPYPSRKVGGVTCRQHEFVASIDNTCRATKEKVSARCCAKA
jgi:hypothetical protein